MRKKIGLLFLASLLLNVMTISAQDLDDEVIEMPPRIAKNLLKVNLTSLALNNYSVQYERPISRKISFAIGGRFMPDGKIPFSNVVKDLVKSDDPNDDMSGQIDNFRIGNFAVTPEIRFYMGKEAMKGFYIAPFARYAKFNITFPFDLEGERIDLSGDLSTFAGGIMFGAQFKLSKAVYLDWHILGPHYGKASGNILGKKTLTEMEQQELRDQLAELGDIPFVKFESTVTSSGAEVKVDGPWAGIRAGLSIGIRF